jgi:phage terminase large subunit-like protein
MNREAEEVMRDLSADEACVSRSISASQSEPFRIDPVVAIRESDRLRGPQFDLAWADELAAWLEPQSTFDMLIFALRLGKHPRWLVTTTPRPVKLLKALLAREGQDVVVTRGSTFENEANLAPTFIQALRNCYEGTRLGRQEINTEMLTDTPGALCQLEWLIATA